MSERKLPMDCKLQRSGKCEWNGHAAEVKPLTVGWRVKSGRHLKRLGMRFQLFVLAKACKGAFGLTRLYPRGDAAAPARIWLCVESEKQAHLIYNYCVKWHFILSFSLQFENWSPCVWRECEGKWTDSIQEQQPFLIYIARCVSFMSNFRFTRQKNWIKSRRSVLKNCCRCK